MNALEQENERLKGEIERLKQDIKKGEIRKKIIANINALLDRSLYELSVINKINMSLSKTLNYIEIINDVVALLSQMIEYITCGVLIFDDEKLLLRIYPSFPRTRSFINDFKEKTLKKYIGLCGPLPKDKEVVLEINNPSLVIENKGKDKVVGAFECMPFKVRQKIIGLLSIAGGKVNTFSPEDMRLIKMLTDNAAIAIENGLLHKRVEELAITDGLTSVYNHRYFKESLHKEIKRAERYNLTFSLLMFDIDDFKNINDLYGHPKGDEVLKGLSYIAKEVFQREIDVVARYGGEEFVVILPQTTKDRAAIVGEKFLSSVREKLSSLADLSEPVTISLGIASYPDDGATERDIIQSADNALYAAKKGGKDRIVLSQK